MKNYYEILGVYPFAEDIVIKAAYKALAQKYHPDRWRENHKFAEEKLKEINLAYSILSDPIKRKEYDLTINKEIYYENEEEEELFSAIDKDWNVASEYYEDLVNIERHLLRISKILCYTYKFYLLESKRFDERVRIANLLEDKFLKTYFGDNNDILNLVRYLINLNYRDALKELNKVVKILGANLDAGIVITKICEKFKIAYLDNDGLYTRCNRLFISEEIKDGIELLKYSGCQINNIDEKRVKIKYQELNFDTNTTTLYLIAYDLAKSYIGSKDKNLYYLKLKEKIQKIKNW